MVKPEARFCAQHPRASPLLDNPGRAGEDIHVGTDVTLFIPDERIDPAA